MAAGRRFVLRGQARHPKNATRALRELIYRARETTLGKLNNTQEIPLAVAPATATVTTIRGVRASSVVLLHPLDAATAANYALGTTYAVPTADTVTINHPAAAGARTYRVALFA